MHGETLEMILAGNAKKGDVLGIARLAGRANLLPRHHLLPFTGVRPDWQRNAAVLGSSLEDRPLDNLPARPIRL